MKAVIALGNPEIKYSKTRHNVGFMVADKLLERRSLKVVQKFQSFFAKDNDALFVMPTTYMNLSGRAVVEVMNFYKLTNRDLLVVYDDISLPLGALRFRKDGSSGGHNGIKSIEKSIGTSDFDRLKVGIGPQPSGMPLESYVLQNFSLAQEKPLQEILDISANAVQEWLSADMTALQSKYNKVWL